MYVIFLYNGDANNDQVSDSDQRNDVIDIVDYTCLAFGLVLYHAIRMIDNLHNCHARDGMVHAHSWTKSNDILWGHYIYWPRFVMFCDNIANVSVSKSKHLWRPNPCICNC